MNEYTRIIVLCQILLEELSGQSIKLCDKLACLPAGNIRNANKARLAQIDGAIMAINHLIDAIS